MIADDLLLVGAALAGTLLSSLLACVPALHIYNVAGLVLIWALEAGDALPAEVLALFMLGLVVGYALGNSIPGIFWGAPDESTVFIVLPGQKYLMQWTQ